MKIKKLLLSFLILFSSTPSFAESDREQIPAIQLRSEYECSDIQVENVVDWFKGYHEVNSLDLRIGEPQNQLDVGWCFSYTVRDLIHFETDIEPELGIITKDYYTGFVGNITGFLSKNEGGYIYNNLKRTRKNGICEKGNINKSATPKNVKEVKCTSKRVSIKKYGKSKKLTSKSKGRSHHLFSELDRYLKQGQMVGISYNANGLYHDKYRDDNWFSKYSANHASSIVGRYFDRLSNSCRYIIRNSWGTHHNYALKGPQRDGYHTITEEDLSESLADINVFQ